MSRPPSLLQALSAEALKLRGTLAMWMCVIAPALVAMVFALQLLVITLKGPTPDPALAWRHYGGGVVALWAFLMLPLFVTLQAALLGALEHGNQQWKHLLALSTPRRYHYLAKLLALVAMLALASIALLGLIALCGAGLERLRPALGISGAPPWRFLCGQIAATALAALPIVALHGWLALRCRNFTSVVAVGMGATVAGFLIGQSRQFGHYFPWTMPLHAIAGEGEKMQAMMIAGLLLGTLVALLGLLDFLRREQG